MIFNNKENEKVDLQDGRSIWISRAVAIVGTICLIKDGVPYFLIGQRGTGAADNHGLWNLPCGYLDWNETTGEAFKREIWEECGLDISPFLNNNIVNYIDIPWDINSNPSENNQNVCVHHGFIAEVDELPETKILNHVEADEVSDIKWVSAKDYLNYEYAFNHKKRIEKFMSKILVKILS
jgi:8-oxo-dGTP pyrophosphatase MutT (NUDIX family)